MFYTEINANIVNVNLGAIVKFSGDNIGLLSD
jgi:hypothetical protein